ncbi:MAG TPA: hypothetical protein VFS43_09135 [Polyangiaceae bacterium]|nr:hypothetical protein [Polyangiaceae bacterium]
MRNQPEGLAEGVIKMAKLTPVKAHRPAHQTDEQLPNQASEPPKGALPRPSARRAKGSATAERPSERLPALELLRAEIDALPRGEARRINVNVPAAAILALGALPKIMALRDTMLAKLVDPPLEALDKLADYALAAAQAHARVSPRGEGETRVRTLLNEAGPLRERMLLNAESLANFGLLDATRVASIRRGAGHVDTAQDLLALSAVFGEAWPTLASKTPLTAADVARAAQLGELLLEALGHRQSGADGSADPDAAEERLAKAYELFFRAYDECRRAVIYLRWHEGDADQIAPSLMRSRRRRRRSPDGSEPDSVAPPPDEPGNEAELAPASPAAASKPPPHGRRRPASPCFRKPSC